MGWKEIIMLAFAVHRFLDGRDYGNLSHSFVEACVRI